MQSIAIRAFAHIVIPAEDDQQCRRRGGNEEQTILGERVGPEEAHPRILVPNHVLLILVDTIQNGQVEIGRRVVFGHVTGIGAEQLMSDQGSVGKRQRRVASRMALELARWSAFEGADRTKQRRLTSRAFRSASNT